MSKDIAVVILNYNGEAMLSRFLPSVVKYSSGARVIVADNASIDNSVSLLRASFPSVELLELERNYGYAEGYNRALAQIDAAYYMLLNSDVEVTEGWLAPLLELMESDKEVAACQPKLLAFNKKTHFEYAGASGGFIDRYGYSYCRGRLFATVEEDKGQYDDVRDIFWATGAALMVRGSVFKASGGFDGCFFAHMEEIDLCWRMLARGGKIKVVPSSAVYHVGGATLDKSNPRKTYLNFRNNLLMLYKNLPEKELRGVMRVRRLLDYVAALKFLVSGSVGDFRAVLRARRDFRRIKGDFISARAENQSKSIHDPFAAVGRFSVLWQYYVRGKRCFSQLNRIF